MNSARARELAETYRQDLLETVSFWERHSVDDTHGGFRFYLDRDGSVYGDDKPVWLLGRAVWLYATLHRDVEPRERWLELARHGWKFIKDHAFAPSGKMYFLLDRAGKPLRMRRYWYSEVFAVLAAAALYRATDEAELLDEALTIYSRFERALTDPSASEPKTNPDVRPAKGLAPLMCELLLCDVLFRCTQDQRFEAAIDRAATEVFTDFVKPDDASVLEAVGPNGERLDGPDGRVMNPGHVIEAGWFMLEIAKRRNDTALVQRTLPLIDWPLERGWDAQYGGLLYFIDVAGKPAIQLEHDMKLWWPHCETLYATLLAYELTNEQRYIDAYERVHAYTSEHFPDREHGEWYGYLHRDGTVSTPIKGGPWKGPFHVPRTQLLCWRACQNLAAERS